MEAVKKLFPGDHIEVAKMDAATCIAYCSKEESRVSMPVEIGQRKTTEKLNPVAAIKSGKRSLEILEEDPKIWRSLKHLRELEVAISAPRNFMTSAILLTGKTGTGKSKIASIIADYLGESAWLAPDLQWFDGYNMESLAIIDEMRSCPASLGLRLFDRYPMRVPIKGGFMNWIPKMVIMTSNLQLENIFSGLDNVTIEAIQRRIKEYVVY